MKRVIKIIGAYDEEVKYALREEYKNFGIYQHLTPTGYLVHQDWLITNGKLNVFIKSFNNYCKEEVLDAIDNYDEIKKFGLRVIVKDSDTYVVHPSGKTNI